MPMAKCDLCGEKAGWLQSRHPACESNAKNLETRLHEMVFSGARAGKDYTELKREAEVAANDNQLSLEPFKVALLQAVNDAATQIALAAPVNEAELTRLVNILQGFGIDDFPGQLAQRRWFGMPYLSMSHTLWQVLHDVTPFYDGRPMQFNLGPGELPVFSGGATTYAEERTVSSRSRAYEGLSLPIGGGIYYHVGRSHGHESSGLLPLDVGELLITNQALYFGGQKRTLRISLDQVIRYQAYVDAIGVCEYRGAPKVFVPDYQGMETGWFFFNLLSAITAKLKSA